MKYQKMNPTDILVNQVKTIKDPADAVPVLAEMFLRMSEKMDRDAEENKKDHELILRTLNGDPQDQSFSDHAIHGRLRTVENNVSNMKQTLETHEKLLRGDPGNPEECGLVDNVQSAMRTTRATHRIMWIVLGVFIPIVVAVIINLLP